MRYAILLLVATSAIAADPAPELRAENGSEPIESPATETVAAATESAPAQADPDRVESMARSAERRAAGCCDGTASDRARADRIGRALERRLSRPSAGRWPR